MYPTKEMIEKTYRIGIEFDGFNRTICLDIDEQDIMLLFDSIGKYDFFRKQDIPGDVSLKISEPHTN